MPVLKNLINGPNSLVSQNVLTFNTQPYAVGFLFILHCMCTFVKHV